MRIDVRGWELHLKGSNKGRRGKPMPPTHNASFFKLCQEGELDIVRAMVERTQVELEHVGVYDWKPLHTAADKGHLPVVQYLCEQGADKEARDDGGKTPLHKAARHRHLPVVQYLCEQGADKEARTDSGWTPLHFAALNGHLPVVQYLCEKGADKEARDDGGMTPLHLAEGAVDGKDMDDDFYLDEERIWERRDRRLLVVEYLRELV
jgi:ankyrin repeat protein